MVKVKIIKLSDLAAGLSAMTREPLNTVIDEWEYFFTHVFKAVPVNEVQKLEMKMVFFAGATGVLQIFERLSRGLGEDALSDDAGAAVMQSLIDEVQAFGEEYMRRREEMMKNGRRTGDSPDTEGGDTP